MLIWSLQLHITHVLHALSVRFLKAYRRHNVILNWVKGHANNIENERCDALAVEAAEGGELKIDEWYENSQKNNTLF